MKRRTLLKSAAAAAVAATAALPRAIHAQAARKLTFLTWNLVDMEDLIRGWIRGFTATRPGVEVEWVDKKGPELPAFYQTQLAAGTPPDVIDIQGALGLEYAGQGALVDLTARLAADSAYKGAFEQAYLANWVLDGKNWMVPYYISKTLLFWNRTMFRTIGLDRPPQSFDEILDVSRRLTNNDKSGFLTLNFDWLYWPLFQMNEVELLTPQRDRVAFNTPRAIEVLDKLARATTDGAINRISWTGRWVEPNGAFASGNVGMLHAHSPAYFFVKSQGPWVSPETLGAAQMPGNWATPNSHGLGISRGSPQQDLAWEFVKYWTGERVAGEFSSNRRVLTGVTAIDRALMDRLAREEPLAATVLRTQYEHTDKQCGNWPLANDSRVKDAFWPELQNAVLGRKDARTALADAERAVARELRRA
jgi:ABC-type glycerol-3-phosphate transport system substrate-binding protein